MGEEGTFEAEQDAAMADQIAAIAAAQLAAEKKQAKPTGQVPREHRIRGQRRKRAKIANASRRKNRGRG